MEDILQTLIDLRLAHTGISISDQPTKTTDGRYRRRRKNSRDGNQCDNNNNHLDSSALITIDEDILRQAMNRLSMNNLISSKHNPSTFDPNYLRMTNRR